MPSLTGLQRGGIVKGRFRYRLDRLLGEGTFGTVWQAECLDSSTRMAGDLPAVVAVKFFRLFAEDSSKKFIRRELSALLSMRADCIPRVYDWVVDDRLSFFVMDFFAQGSLTQVFRLAGSLQEEACWRLLKDLLSALRSAHGAGILHLDIRPANIMLDGTGGYKLVDFGISQATQVPRGSARTIGLGSHGYQAPEQRRKELAGLDTRTDLWAVGATVWAARSGLDLKLHRDQITVDVQGSEPTLPPFSTVGVDCSAELEQIVIDLVRNDPKERPGGAAEVLSRVHASAAGLPLADDDFREARRGSGEHEVREVIDSLMDPLWASICHHADLARYFMKFTDGEFLCREGEVAHHAFVLLRGRVRSERAGREIGVDDREGTFLGELSTLTGAPRSATVRAEGTVWACVFNAAEFERLLAFNPAVAIRLVKLMAERMIHTDVKIR